MRKLGKMMKMMAILCCLAGCGGGGSGATGTVNVVPDVNGIVIRQLSVDKASVAANQDFAVSSNSEHMLGAQTLSIKIYLNENAGLSSGTRLQIEEYSEVAIGVKTQSSTFSFHRSADGLSINGNVSTALSSINTGSPLYVVMKQCIQGVMVNGVATEFCSDPAGVQVTFP
ncbi:MAG: hypothetical protein HGA36_03615 [Candidatus Moranbacteria bacterium]|nr:hypothetical protein [Candidatus Moranbacteria bacterium]